MGGECRGTCSEGRGNVLAADAAGKGRVILAAREVAAAGVCSAAEWRGLQMETAVVLLGRGFVGLEAAAAVV